MSEPILLAQMTIQELLDEAEYEMEEYGKVNQLLKEYIEALS